MRMGFWPAFWTTGPAWSTAGLENQGHAKPMKLQNLVTVDTGASQGLGRAIAEEFVKQGAYVAVCGRDSQLLAEASSSFEALAGQGQRILAQGGDVSSEGEMKVFFERI